jgi:hypothetical protein
MAVLLRERVRLKLSETGAPGLGIETLQPQPPRWGVVTARDDTVAPIVVDVLFENGVRIAQAPEDAFERVDNAVDSFVQAFLYAVVRPAGLAASQEYTGQVVDVYRIDGQQQYLLVKTRNGMFYEQRPAQVVRVDLEGVPQ